MRVSADALLPERARVEILAFDASDVGGHEAAIDSAWADGDIDLVVFAFGVLGDQSALIEDPLAAARLTSVNHTGEVSV